jgi:23S rRNA (cytosine1962-C5)-methyltransferase
MFINFAVMIDVVLKKGKEKAVLHRHPWVFSGAIENVKGKPANGEIIRLLSMVKKNLWPMAFTTINRALPYVCWSGTRMPLMITGSADKVRTAVAGRAHILADGSTDTCSLIFSESDYLPGLIVDKYAESFGRSDTNSGMQAAMPVIIDELKGPAKPRQAFLIKAMRHHVRTKGWKPPTHYCRQPTA